VTEKLFICIVKHILNVSLVTAICTGTVQCYFAVVMQVTGELSNDMGPMRRFMQTFILARQTPKMFYVYNDIFRYQDEVFHDFVDGFSADVTENRAVLGT